MADVELLPLPRWMETYRIPGDDFHTGPDQYLSDRMQTYASANLAPLQAENERLRAEVELWRHKAATHKYRRERLAEALRDAATSMQTIADKAGRDEYLMTTDEVRCYANSRANVARAALEQENSDG